MLNEFCVITGAVSASFEKTWEEYKQLIFKYSPLEEKREVKKLLSEYQAKESECAGDFLSTGVMVGVYSFHHSYRSTYIVCPQTTECSPWSGKETGTCYSF